MTSPIEAYPLTWPAGQQRTRTRQFAPFSQTVTSAQEGLLRELRLLGATDVVISSDVGPRKQDGTFYARANMNPSDPGVAVYFTRKGIQQCIACDRYNRVHNNMHAIALTIGALRGIERWGSTEMVDKAFTGFAALPDPTAVATWWDTLGVPRTAMTDQVEARYRELVKTAHPDVGGSHDQMSRLNSAIESFRAERGLSR